MFGRLGVVRLKRTETVSYPCRKDHDRTIERLGEGRPPPNRSDRFSVVISGIRSKIENEKKANGNKSKTSGDRDRSP